MDSPEDSGDRVPAQCESLQAHNYISEDST
jgi:hypothetical protein